MEFHLQSCVCGCHVYGEHLSAFLGDELACQQKLGTVLDQYAVAVKKDTGKIVGHVPKISRICSSFLQHGSTIGP